MKNKMDDLISRQAAIAAIQNLYPGMPRTDICNSLNRWYEKNKQYIECEDAINKLPSVQPEKVCIANITLSEEQVLEAVEKAKSEIIQSLPSTQPERKTGKWIITDIDIINRVWHCNCSECGEDPLHFISGTEDWWLNKLPNYCPNCGADME